MTYLDSVEDDVREMLQRRADDVGQAVPAPEIDAVQGHRQSVSPVFLTAAAVVLVVTVAGGTLLAARDSGNGETTVVVGDQSFGQVAPPPATEPSEAVGDEPTEEPAEDTSVGDELVVPFEPDPNQQWGTALPSLDQLPEGFNFDSLNSLFIGDGEASDVVDAYLADRFFGSEFLGVAATRVEIVDRYALFRWGWEPSTGDTVFGEGEAGWVYLALVDGDWRVIATTTDGVDLSDLVRDSRGVRGVVTSSSDNQLYFDVVDVTTGRPFDAATGQALEQTTGGYLFGTAATGGNGELSVDLSIGRQGYAVRVSHIGPSTLTLSEFVFAQTLRRTDAFVLIDPTSVEAGQIATLLDSDGRVLDYRELDASTTFGTFEFRFDGDSPAALAWRDSVPLTSFAIALANRDDLAAFDRDLTATSGVIAVVEPPIPRPQREYNADELVVEVRDVPFALAPTECGAPLGIETPPNTIEVVADPIPANTSREALEAFFAGSSPKPQSSSGFIELVEPDGTISYGHSEFDYGLLIVGRLGEIDGGIAVIEWETTGC